MSAAHGRGGDREALARATAAQRRAADPSSSAWVAANAGAGKTRVLVDRVARLLLAGTRPHAILCLTYTKAAAAEMASRLSQRLGGWVAADDATLDGELAGLVRGERRHDDALRRRARRLFAETLDAPLGLRIQTIHSFCESLLRRFPLEAGLTPHFSIADDTETVALLKSARDAMLRDRGSDPAIAAAIADAVGAADDRSFIAALDDLAMARSRLRRLLARHGDDPESAIAALRESLGLSPDETADLVAARFIAEMPRAELRRAIAALAHGSRTDVERGAGMAAWLDAPEPKPGLEPWFDRFLSGKGQPLERLATLAVQARDAQVEPILRGEQARVIACRDRLAAARLLRASAAMLRLGARITSLFEAVKRARGLLDYDDLIIKSLALLENEDGAWVRFKLDGGIDHILVDEAQDTSPEQWRIIAMLSEEFFAGEGARGDAARTIFAVGDEKQSIFSFQGAEPGAFTAIRDAFAARADVAKRDFVRVNLDFSFRSTHAVLDAVDAVFAREQALAGVATQPTRHLAIRGGEPGLVELWPVVEPPPKVDDSPWDAPLDYVSRTSPPTVLAGRIAAMIAGWLGAGERLAASGEAIRPGDVMILVRSRNRFFAEMVRALKSAAVPVAGADRLVLADHIAVQDLIALGRVALLPDDELTLACLLKSPFFGFDDDDLFALAHGRERRLWHELRARAAERPRWAAAAERLLQIIARADFMPPFEFYARALDLEGGRARIFARLGTEAADPLDEFLARALAYETQHPPSLEGFLHWLERGGAEIKRDMEQARDEVRVMTVHAAKGLEAPIVFLPDTCTVPDGNWDPRLLWPGTREPALLWPIRTANDGVLGAAARQSARDARLEEYRRLLYVALTRARDRLYVAGWRGERALGEGSWYTMINAALRARADAEPVKLPWGDEGWRIAAKIAPVAAAPLAAVRRSPAALPDWARAPAPVEPRPPRPLSPSSAAAGAMPAGPLAGGHAVAARRGRLLHRLLELLPRVATKDWREAARRLLARLAGDLDTGAVDALVEEALGVIATHPDLFAADGRSEVAIAGMVGSVPIAGQVDRLVVRAHEVLLLDFKSSRAPPRRVEQTPPAYVAQLGLYAALLEPLFPQAKLRCFVLWTAGPRLCELPPEMLRSAVESSLNI